MPRHVVVVASVNLNGPQDSQAKWLHMNIVIDKLGKAPESKSLSMGTASSRINAGMLPKVTSGSRDRHPRSTRFVLVSMLAFELAHITDA